MSEPPATSTVRVKLGKPLAALAQADSFGQVFHELTQTKIDSTCYRLGIIPQAELVVETVDQELPLQISIDGVESDVGTLALESALAFHLDDPQPILLQQTAWDVLGQSLAAGESDERREFARAAVTDIVASVVDDHPQQLISRAHLRRIMSISEIKPVEPSETGLDFETVLTDAVRAAIELNTPISDVDALVRIAVDGVNEGDAARDIGETITAELRSQRIEIRANEKYLMSILGSVPRRPVSPWDDLLPAGWGEMFDIMADGLFYELGIRQPGVSISADPELPEDCFSISIGAGPQFKYRGLPTDSYLYNAGPAELAKMGIEGRARMNPANRNPCTIAPSRVAGAADDAGITTWDAVGYIVLTIAAVIRREAWRLGDRDVMDYELSMLQQAFPALVEAMMGGLSSRLLVRILRELLKEEISVRDLRQILEALLRETLLIREHPPGFEHDAAYYAELVRAEMKAYISHKYTRGQNQLSIYLIDPAMESALQAIVTSQAEAKIVKQTRSKMRNAVRGTVSSLGDSPLVILTQMALRRYLKRLLADEFPSCTVLSFWELSPDLNIVPLGKIG